MHTQAIVRTAAFTRLANATQYTAGDAVSDHATTPTAASFTLLGMGRGGVIKSVFLTKSDTDLTGADFDIYFFDTQPVATGYEDNVAIAITAAEWAKCIGFVSMTATADAKAVATADAFNKTNLDLPYQCVGTSNDIYFVIVARGTYTPASEEVFTIRVGAVIQ